MLPEEQLISGEKQLKEFSIFLNKHDNVLNELIHKSIVISDSQNENDAEVTGTRKKIFSSDATSVLSHRPFSSKAKRILRLQEGSSIGIDYSLAVEAISTMDLITSDNKCLNKMIAVFVQLCMEVRQLCKEGNDILLNFLFADEDLYHKLSREDDDDENFGDPQIANNLKSGEQLDGILLTPDVISLISSLLELLLQACQFIERCFVVIVEIINQFSALFAADNKYYVNVDNSSLYFQTVFSYLADATILIVKFDNVFKNGQLQNVWPHYIEAIKLTEQNLCKFNARRDSTNGSEKFMADDINSLRNIFFKVDYLFVEDLFQNLINSTFQIKSQVKAQSLSLFSVQFHSYLRNTLIHVQKYVNLQIGNNYNIGSNAFLSSAAAATGETTTEILLGIIDDMVVDPSKLVLSLNTMSILYHHLFGNLDQKIFQSVIENNTKFPCIVLIENVMWSPDIFLNKYGPTLLLKIRGGVDKMSTTNMQRVRQEWLQIKCEKLVKDAQMYCIQTTLWALKLRTNLDTSEVSQNGERYLANLNNIKIDDINQKILLILQGIELMEKLGNAISIITNLHVYIKCPMTKQCILSICKLIELLKFIKLILDEYSSVICYTSQCLSQYQLYQALFIISCAKKKFQTDSASNTAVYDERTIDILSAMELAETALLGSPNIKRILVARLALTLADPKQLFQSEQLNKICSLFVSIEHLIQLKDTIRTLSSASFMYWHHEAILPIYLRNIFDSGTADCEKLQYIFRSAVDCHNNIMARKSINFDCSVQFMRRTASTLNGLIAGKLCGYIETKLRLDVHTNLQLLAVENINPFNMNSGSTLKMEPLLDLYRILQLHPIHVVNSHATDSLATMPIDRYLTVRDHVNIYLSQMFYNLTTVSMHDWRTYGQMRFLAEQKFQLETIEDYLPTQTLEQGLDVLEIMRNIHLFVSKYLYNLNNQIFIEKNSNNKHLNTINIRHIANSLRTHGIGIINTTVNFTYQFLHKKFYIFSQFLHNEHIQSRLIRDLKSFREANLEKAEEQQMYNYEKASSFNKGIRQLGVSENGQSSLDLFRQLITHIGNAMGYVRMMRSGGIHSCSNASAFLPIVNQELQFRTLCEKSQLCFVTVNAATNLEYDISHLIHNYAEGTEYFRLLVDAFSPFFCNDKNPHLKLFYLIVPALTLNYIEYIITAKEKMNKKAKQQGTWFTDDGFAMGLAYVLKLLNQNSEFNSLHWFTSVRKKYANELRQLAATKQANSNGNNDAATDNYNAKLQETLALSEKRINIILEEFDLFYCNLNSAKIFFQ